MGFVGGGGCNINIATTLHKYFFVYCIVNIRQFMALVYLIVYACLRLRFLYVATNPGPLRLVPTYPAVCGILCSNVLGLAGYLCDLTVAPYWYDILLCSETLVSDLRHMSELLIPGFGLCLVPWQDTSAPRDGSICMRGPNFRQPNFECGCFCEMLVFSVGGVRQYVYVVILYCSPDLDDMIFDCLQT